MRKQYIVPSITLFEVETMKIMDVSGSANAQSTILMTTDAAGSGGLGYEADAATYRNTLWD